MRFDVEADKKPLQSLGNQIGRMFAYWAIVSFWQFFLKKLCTDVPRQYSLGHFYQR
jgi:hypothetical protein